MLRLRAAAFILVLGFALWPMLVAAGDPVEDIAGELMCQCGCGMTLPVCASSMECMIGDQMRDVIRQQLEEGKTKGEIVQYFVDIYGEKVLASPTKSGFNMTAWLAPFVALVAGAGVASRLVYEWRNRKSEAPVAVTAADEAGNEDLRRYEDLVDRELKDF